MKFSIIAFCVLILGAAAYLNAEDAKPKEVKGLDVVSDTAITVIKKTNAFFQGNLEITMSGDKDRHNKKDDYTVNAMGARVPRSTAVK